MRPSGRVPIAQAFSLPPLKLIDAYPSPSKPVSATPQW
jgi:hypothetical protein